MATRKVGKGLIRSIALPHSVRFTIACHARMAFPAECCGLLVGNGRAILAAIATTNVSSESRTRFEVDPAAHIALQRTLRHSKTRAGIIGVYHSHPASDATLSERDLADAHYDGWVHIVVGDVATRPRMQAYQVRAGQASIVRLLGTTRKRRRVGKHLS